MQAAILSFSRDLWTADTVIESMQSDHLMQILDFIAMPQLLPKYSNDIFNIGFNPLILPI